MLADGISGNTLLEDAIRECLQENVAQGWLRVPVTAGRLRAQLFGLGTILNERVDTDGSWLIEIRAPRHDLEQLCRREGLPFELAPSESGGHVAGAGQAP